MKFRVMCDENVTTEFSVEASNREILDTWLEKEGPNVVSLFTQRQTVHERNYEVSEEPLGENTSVDVSVDDTLKRIGDILLDDKEGFVDRVNETHGRLAAQIQARGSGNIRKILTETPSMKAEDPNVIIQNCYIQAREGDEGFHLKSPLVIDGYAIIPKEAILTFAELLRGVTK